MRWGSNLGELVQVGDGKDWGGGGGGLCRFQHWYGRNICTRF